MLRMMALYSFLALNAACALMPGMENLDTAQMRRTPLLPPLRTVPKLTLITPAFVACRPRKTYVYRVAPADVLNITVWEHPEFNASPLQSTVTAVMPATQGAAGQIGYLVNAEGKIYFPLVGYVVVAKKTVDEIRAEISERLKKYIPNPQVNVRVVDYRGQKVYIVGEVKKPGFLPLNDQVLTIADALALSGGINQDFADPKHIYVIRGPVIRPRIYWLNAKTADRLLLAEHFDLYPKDILYVSSAPATQWNRVLKQLLPTLESIWYTKAITNS